jgi:hypothetical protein
MSVQSTQLLIDRLGLKQDMSAYYLRAPQEYWQELGIKQAQYNDDSGEYDFIHAFFTNLDEMSNFADILVSKLSHTGMLWVSWPKLSADNDNHSAISIQDIRDVFLAHGVIDTKESDVTDNWLGVKFVWKTT